MTDINVDEIGPVDYLVVGFRQKQRNFSGEMASELKALNQQQQDPGARPHTHHEGRRRFRGGVRAARCRRREVGELRALERDLAILLAEEDVEDIGASLEPGSAAAVLVWENTWAAPFGSAVRRSGGELGQRPDPDASAHRGCRSGSPSRNERSMKMGLFRDRGDRPGLLGGRERRGDRRDDRQDDRGDRRDDRGDRVMTAATAVADPGCCGDSSMRAPTSKTDGPLAAVAYNASHGSVTW